MASGKVQGVFFRANTKDVAREAGVTGWVRNTRDNGVEAVFEGEKEDIEHVLEFCRKGPEGSSVTRLDVKWEKYKGEFSGFEIRY